MEVKCGEREKNLWLIIFYLEKFFPQDEGPASDRTLHFCVNLAAHMLQSPNRKRQVSVATESRTHGWKHGAFAGVRTGLLKCVVPDLVSLNSRFTCGLDTHTHTHAHYRSVQKKFDSVFTALHHWRLRRKATTAELCTDFCHFTEGRSLNHSINLHHLKIYTLLKYQSVVFETCFSRTSICTLIFFRFRKSVSRKTG